MRLFLPMLVLMTLGAQCSENNVNKIDDTDADDLSPELSVNPERIDFGELRDGETATEEIRIRNVGNTFLTISSITLRGPTAYTISDTSSITGLDPDEEATFTVSFSPNTLEHEGQVLITSDDPSATITAVPLDGYGALPLLHVTPSPYDFGIVEPDCVRPGTVTLENIGRETLVIDNLAQVGSGFQLVDDVALPIVLEPNQSQDITLEFAPIEVAGYEGELWITSNGGDAVVQESGEGGPVGAYQDDWVQPTSGKADLFFYVDQSCSMEDDQDRLASNFQQFTEDLENLDTDFLVMVATQDSGCHNGSAITDETPVEQRASLFRAAVTGASGIFTEAGLTIIRNAMATNQLEGCNAEFLRDGATVSFVLISDEPEQSPPSIPYSDAVAGILRVAPNAYINAIAGPVPDGCATAEPGTGYYEASVLTGGLFRSICDINWGETLGDLAELATTARPSDTFYLSHEPQPDTIRVYVDSMATLDGWSYNENSNTIVFEPDHVPGEGALITAAYASGFTCD